VKHPDIYGQPRVTTCQLLKQHRVRDAALHDAADTADLLRQDGSLPAEVGDGLHARIHSFVRDFLIVPVPTIELEPQRHDHLVYQIVESIHDAELVALGTPRMPTPMIDRDPDAARVREAIAAGASGVEEIMRHTGLPLRAVLRVLPTLERYS